MRKLAARWEPDLLNDDQKKQRVACSCKLLNEFEHNGPKQLCDKVTGNESWLMFYGIPNKCCNRMWVGPNRDQPVVLRPGFQSCRWLFSIFFNTKGLVAIDILPEKSTTAASYYTQAVLLAKAVRSELSSLSKTDYQRALEDWRMRLEICIWANGEYFEWM